MQKIKASSISKFNIRYKLRFYLPCASVINTFTVFMLTFPNAKINIGLRITGKRADGFHNIETVFYPVDLKDIMEVLPAGEKLDFRLSGIELDGNAHDNLCLKAYRLLQTDFNLPAVKIHLHKIIPAGAGLGGGSADASFTLKALNRLFNLNLSLLKLQSYARRLGSDCAFFIENKPVFAFEKGDIFKPISLKLSSYKIILLFPEQHVSTAKAYAGVQPQLPEASLENLIRQPIENWRNLIFNDFEKPIFHLYPQIGQLKKDLYDLGAVYASMSGSGSAVYGIFEPEQLQKIDFVSVFHKKVRFKIC